MTSIRTYKKYKNYKKNSYGTGTLCSGEDELV